MNRIPIILKQKGWTADKLATETQISPPAILELVNAAEIPPDTPWATIKKVAHTLDVKLDELEVSTKPELSLAEKRRLVDKLCGAWADDDSIPAIFAEIERERKASMPRPVNFDETS